MIAQAHPFDEASGRAVDLANELTDDLQEADLWDIADGVLSGAIHYWLYSRQPCDDLRCEECAEVATAHQRMLELRRLLEELAETSSYFHSTNDHDVAHA